MFGSLTKGAKDTNEGDGKTSGHDHVIEMVDIPAQQKNKSHEAKEEKEDERTEAERIRELTKEKLKTKRIDPDDLTDEELPTMRSGLGASRWQLALMLYKYPLLRKYRRHRLEATLEEASANTLNKWTSGSKAEQLLVTAKREISQLKLQLNAPRTKQRRGGGDVPRGGSRGGSRGGPKGGHKQTSQQKFVDTSEED